MTDRVSDLLSGALWTHVVHGLVETYRQTNLPASPSYPHFAGKIAISKPLTQSALRTGRPKIVYFYEDETVELHDLGSDPGEQRDPAQAQPEIARRLVTRLKKDLQDSNARLPERVTSKQE